MTSKLWMGIGRRMLPVPGFLWKRRVRTGAKHAAASLAFMSEEHHLVREFAVRELPRAGKPMPAEFIAGKLNLPLDRVGVILADLEEHMTFVCRDEEGAVEWAYPVTAFKTPHEVTFSTGERLYSA
jgi:hypothetical protein